MDKWFKHLIPSNQPLGKGSEGHQAGDESREIQIVKKMFLTAEFKLGRLKRVQQKNIFRTYINSNC